MSSDPLTKVYLELTTACNLDCLMCVRRTWKNETFGPMDWELYRSFTQQLADFPEPPTVHFAGYGEPLTYPRFLEAVALAKEAGARVEVTSNGTLLTPELIRELIELELDRLVVSVDGVSENVYDEIRQGSEFGRVINNLLELQRQKLTRYGRTPGKPTMGLAFVAMKRNVADLARLPQLAHRVGAEEIKVSNVVPYYPELEAEMLYDRAMYSLAFRSSPQIPSLSLPKMNLDENTFPALAALFDSTVSIKWLQSDLDRYTNYCEFAHKGYTVIRRDGAVSPCLELMRDHPVYLLGKPQQITHYTVGNIGEQSLWEIWNSPEYSGFRDKVRRFPYSPCLTCGGCEWFEANKEDCRSNTFPVCGRCPWAQGLVQCP
ncbi:radical SAM protein [Oceanithermus sp.]